jgi:hypothetical protein
MMFTESFNPQLRETKVVAGAKSGSATANGCLLIGLE